MLAPAAQPHRPDGEKHAGMGPVSTGSPFQGVLWGWAWEATCHGVRELKAR